MAADTPEEEEAYGPKGQRGVWSTRGESPCPGGHRHCHDARLRRSIHVMCPSNSALCDAAAAATTSYCWCSLSPPSSTIVNQSHVTRRCLPWHGHGCEHGNGPRHRWRHGKEDCSGAMMSRQGRAVGRSNNTRAFPRDTGRKRVRRREEACSGELGIERNDTGT
uniref:Uncharacterized protein n=1 Tax=Zea mays TaxID=4577 RepID=A0A804NNK4_MAIZE